MEIQTISFVYTILQPTFLYNYFGYFFVRFCFSYKFLFIQILCMYIILRQGFIPVCAQCNGWPLVKFSYWYLGIHVPLLVKSVLYYDILNHKDDIFILNQGPASCVSCYHSTSTDFLSGFPFLYTGMAMVSINNPMFKHDSGTESGPRLNIKTVLSKYGYFHVKDKTAGRTSYL